MASPGAAEVQALIAAAVAEQEARMGQILAGQVSARQAEIAIRTIVEEANKGFAAQFGKDQWDDHWLQRTVRNAQAGD